MESHASLESCWVTKVVLWLLTKEVHEIWKEFSGNIDNGPKKSSLNVCDVLDTTGTLQKIKAMGLWSSSQWLCYETLYYSFLYVGAGHNMWQDPWYGALDGDWILWEKVKVRSVSAGYTSIKLLRWDEPVPPKVHLALKNCTIKRCQDNIQKGRDWRQDVDSGFLSLY